MEELMPSLGASKSQSILEALVWKQYRRDELAYYDYIKHKGINPATLHEAQARQQEETNQKQTTLDM